MNIRRILATVVLTTTAMLGLVVISPVAAQANTISTLVTKIGSDVVGVNTTLRAGQYILSKDVRFALVMQSDGNLVLYGTDGGARSVARWATGTNGKGAVRATFQSDGNLVLYRSDNQPVWASRTDGSGAATLAVQADGNVVLYRGGGVAVWQTGTGGRPQVTYQGGDQLHPDQHMSRNTYLRSEDGRYALLFQNDSNLVLYGPAYQVLWASSTGGSGAADLVVQGDGNVVLYRGTTAVWSTGTQGFTITRFQVQDDAQVGAWADSTFVWSSKRGLLVPRPAPAPQTTTITATLRYSDLYQGADRPIREAKVELWRFKPRALGVWTWGVDQVLRTDSAGRINTAVPYETAGITYALRVVAENRAAVVRPNPKTIGAWIPSTLGMDGAMWREPGDNQPIQPRVTAPGQTHDMSWTFTGWAAQHYNIADTLLYAHDYAAAHRGDTDVLNPVAVTWLNIDGVINGGTPFYQPVGSTIRLPAGESMVQLPAGDRKSIKIAYDDPTLAHEYAHYLEHTLSSFYALPAKHNGCNSVDAEFAWMEGFADYFAAAVYDSLPSGTLSTSRPAGILPYSHTHLEESPQCAGSTAEGRTLENRVAAVLWDLADPAGAEPNGQDPVAGQGTTVFQIFDRELDRAPHPLVSFACPTINNFRNAWKSRGLDLTKLDAVFALNGVATADRPASAVPLCTSTGSGSTAALQADTGTIMYTADTTKCLDVRNAATADGTAIQLWTCNGSSAQNWARSGRTLHALGKCLDISGGGTANGTLVQLWTCNGTGAQDWVYQADGTLKNPQSNRCLDVVAGSTAVGARVQIWDCIANSAQRWL
ncbi:ricin-type beta-trefoil lectin domain protein [Frankia sp. Cr1]|uniref:ricin-type beta-trefoil lectin domain protein n=1 Tax=Frankia sp. Cr1 TaxID=3073931 RepID=UPI002AD327CB|nr:ricin-type beta-trefoil lectin domain protein [Frankia sp. Cr1]